MRIRFILAILILLLACGLQFWFASAEVFINFILAALIVFAFYCDIWELIVFVLFAILIVNWQPAVSVDIIIFGIIPIAAFTFHKIFAWTLGAGIPVAIIGGFLILYLLIAPAALIPGWEQFFIDLLGGLLFGGAVFFAFDRLKLS
jgi:hypothetical protein